MDPMGKKMLEKNTLDLWIEALRAEWNMTMQFLVGQTNHAISIDSWWSILGSQAIVALFLEVQLG